MAGGIPPVQGPNGFDNGMGPNPQPQMGGMPMMQPGDQQPMMQGQPAMAGAPMGAQSSMPSNGMQPMQMPNGTVAVPAGPVQKNKSSVIETVVLVIVCLIAAAAIVAAVYFFMEHKKLSQNYESDKAAEVAAAVKAQADKDEENLAERLKETKALFSGPDDYGAINFSYPKVWSVYEAKDGTNNSDYEAFFANAPVPSTIDQNARYALRFTIYNRSYDSITQQYSQKAKMGDVTASVFSADSGKLTGMRYDGKLELGINGVAVVVKVNDKCLVIQTDSKDYYLKDFEAIISTLRMGQ